MNNQMKLATYCFAGIIVFLSIIREVNRFLDYFLFSFNLSVVFLRIGLSLAIVYLCVLACLYLKSRSEK